jgi:hypothetical protein
MPSTREAAHRGVAVAKAFAQENPSTMFGQDLGESRLEGGE